MRRLLVMWTVVLLAWGGLWAPRVGAEERGEVDAGEKGAAFLNIAVGARAAAMGASFVGLGDDLSTIYWNPAGLVHLEGNYLLVSHHEWVDDVRHEFIAYGNADRGYGGIALRLCCPWATLG